MSVWLPALISVAGALLAFLGARLGVRAELSATAQRDQQSRRDEWGRRFTTALMMVADADARRRRIGRALLDALCTSELAGAADRGLAAQLLSVVAVESVPPQRRPMDEVTFTEQNRGGEGFEGGAR